MIYPEGVKVLGSEKVSYFRLLTMEKSDDLIYAVAPAVSFSVSAEP